MKGLQEVPMVETERSGEGTLSDALAGKREEIIELLRTAYLAELEVFC